jgi:hypothetical protein
LANVGLESATAYAKPRCDFLDREQFWNFLLTHRSIPHAVMLFGIAVSFAIDSSVGQNDELD